MANAGYTLRERIMSFSLDAGTERVRISAARALYVNDSAIEEKLMGKLTSDVLREITASVAVRLSMLVARQAKVSEVIFIAAGLAAGSRRVFLLPIAIVLASRDSTAADELIAMLPKKHPAVLWATGDKNIDLIEEHLTNLGDAQSVKATWSVVKKFRP